MVQVSREERVLALKTKLAVLYGVIGFGCGFLWAWLALMLRTATGSGWLGGPLSGVICFLVLGELVMRLFGYLADGTWSTMLSRSPDYSPIDKFLIGMAFFYGFHGALVGVVAQFVIGVGLTFVEIPTTGATWDCAGGVLGLVAASWYGWTEVR